MALVPSLESQLQCSRNATANRNHWRIPRSHQRAGCGIGRAIHQVLPGTLPPTITDLGTQLEFGGLATSTRKAGLALNYLIVPPIKALLKRRRCQSSLADIFHHLSAAAKRTHPTREKVKGRLALGLAHVGQEKTHALLDFDKF